MPSLAIACGPRHIRTAGRPRCPAAGAHRHNAERRGLVHGEGKGKSFRCMRRVGVVGKREGASEAPGAARSRGRAGGRQSCGGSTPPRPLCPHQPPARLPAVRAVRNHSSRSVMSPRCAKSSMPTGDSCGTACWPRRCRQGDGMGGAGRESARASNREAGKLRGSAGQGTLDAKQRNARLAIAP